MGVGKLSKNEAAEKIRRLRRRDRLLIFAYARYAEIFERISYERQKSRLLAIEIERSHLTLCHRRGIHSIAKADDV